jgi:hypothetical protein
MEELKIKLESLATIKKCAKCQLVKNITEFSESKVTRDKLRYICKHCMRKYSKEWYLKNRERIVLMAHKRIAADPKKRKIQAKKYRDTHPETVRVVTQRWRAAHPDKVKALGKRANAKTRASIKGKLNASIATSMGRSLHGTKSGQQWEKLTGYTLEQLKTHLEKQFKDGMTWENYGKWHIDHRIPIKAFTFEKPEDVSFQLCWSLKNLQPLWASENFKKGARLTKEDEIRIKLEVLDFKQALKYLLQKEQYRHAQDILDIGRDLDMLQDVKIPDLPMDLWVDV